MRYGYPTDSKYKKLQGPLELLERDCLQAEALPDTYTQISQGSVATDLRSDGTARFVRSSLGSVLNETVKKL